MHNNKVLSFIGICMKAGHLVSGEFSVEKAVKSGHAWLVLVAADASNNSKKQYTNMCTYYQVPLYFISSKEELGHALGKEYRASLAVQDENMARALIKKLQEAGIAPVDITPKEYDDK